MQPAPPPALSAPRDAVDVDEVTGAMVVELQSSDDVAGTDEEAEAVWAPVRAALESRGSVQEEDGSEIVSLEEVERRLQAGEMEDGEEATTTAAMEQDEAGEEEEEEEEEQEDEEDEEEEEEEEGELVVDNAEQPPSRRAVLASSSPPRSRASSSSNTLWVQERADGSVNIVPWPFSQSDAEAADDDSAYNLNLPPSPPSSPHDVIGRSVGGEVVRVSDVCVLHERDVQEHFSKGGGKGGQKVNKSSNCVHLHHVPTGTIVKCHATRSLAENRKIARRILQERLEELLLGPASANRQRQAKMRKSKAKSRRRTRAKYGDEYTVQGEVTRDTSAASLTTPASTPPSLSPAVPAAAPTAAAAAQQLTPKTAARLLAGEAR